MCAGGWGEVENAIMTMVMNGNKVKVTIFECVLFLRTHEAFLIRSGSS